jgi:integrase
MAELAKPPENAILVTQIVTQESPGRHFIESRKARKIMASTNLTDLKVKNLKNPAGDRLEVWDALLPGFGLRISPAGTKSFILMYRYAGHQRRETIGRYPLLSLSEARGRAKEILQKVGTGEDPVITKKPVKPRDTHLFPHVMADFVNLHCLRHNKPSTQRSTARLLKKEFLPHWQNRPVKDIEKGDILRILDAIVERGAPGAANHAYSAVSKFFGWCAERDIIAANPCADIKRPAQVNARDRVLSDAELVAIWRGVEVQGYPYAPIVKLLMLTGQRRGEVSRMEWQQLDFNSRTWSLPKEATKSKRAHTVPLADKALEVLQALPRVHDRLVFPAKGSTTTCFSGFGKCKQRLDDESGIADWTLHDLRRSAATGMARLGVDPHVVERVLNHSSGTFAGVAGVYNRFQYLPEMREALEKWQTQLFSLLDS